MRFHPILKRSQLHAGRDYAGNTGTPIVAAAGGRVISAGWGGGAGNRIMIDHGIERGVSLVTVYKHLNGFAVRSGTVRYVLTAGIDPIRLAEVLQTQALPADWTASIVDGASRIVARSRQHERFVGVMTAFDLKSQLLQARVDARAKRMPVLPFVSAAIITHCFARLARAAA